MDITSLFIGLLIGVCIWLFDRCSKFEQRALNAEFKNLSWQQRVTASVELEQLAGATARTIKDYADGEISDDQVLIELGNLEIDSAALAERIKNL